MPRAKARKSREEVDEPLNDEAVAPLQESTGSDQDSLHQKRERIVIIGTGNFAIALARRLLEYSHESFDVVFGSREPNADYVHECIHDYSTSKKRYLVQVVSIEEAFALSDTFLFMAVSAYDDVYHFVVDKIARKAKEMKSSSSVAKVIIDISNPVEPNEHASNAEKLQQLFDEYFAKHRVANTLKVHVLKAFNQVNAYAMGAVDFTETKGGAVDQVVSIAGDSPEAKSALTRLCSRIGYSGRDVGPLRNARSLELANSKMAFGEWLWPSVFSLLLLAFNFTWIFIWYYLFPKKPHKDFQEYLGTVSFLAHFNRVLGFTTLHLLAYTYLPGLIAAALQLHRGTKYQRFPRFLDAWLKARKQIGLWAFYIGTIHLCTTIFVLNPAYLDVWYKQTGKNIFGLTTMTLNGEINTFTGILSYMVMCLVALSSINSIAASLNWQEWRFVQTKLGITCLALGFVHDLCMYVRTILERDMYNYDTMYLCTRVKLIVLVLPFFVLLGKFVFAYVPPFSRRLDEIRNGKRVK